NQWHSVPSADDHELPPLLDVDQYAPLSRLPKRLSKSDSYCTTACGDVPDTPATTMQMPCPAAKVGGLANGTSTYSKPLLHADSYTMVCASGAARFVGWCEPFAAVTITFSTASVPAPAFM